MIPIIVDDINSSGASRRKLKMKPSSLVIARLTPKQILRISERGGRIEVSPRRMQEGTHPYLCGFIHLDWPGAVEAFLEALFNESAVIPPSQRLPRLGVAQQLFVCGFFNTHDGSYLVSSIHAKPSPDPIP